MSGCNTDMTSTTHDDLQDATMAAPTPSPLCSRCDANTTSMTTCEMQPRLVPLPHSHMWMWHQHDLNNGGTTSTWLNNSQQLARCDHSCSHPLILTSRCNTDMTSTTTHEMQLWLLPLPCPHIWMWCQHDLNDKDVPLSLLNLSTAYVFYLFTNIYLFLWSLEWIGPGEEVSTVKIYVLVSYSTEPTWRHSTVQITNQLCGL